MIKLPSRYQLLLIACVFLVLSCNKDDDTNTITDPKQYAIPSEYSAFENVSYSGQTQRLGMLTELKSYMKSANTPMTVLDADRLKAMYVNDAASAQWAGTYQDSKQLKSKTFETEQAKFEALFDALALASQSIMEGSNGLAGVVNSLDGQKQYLLGANGLEYAQLIEKGLMGSCLYYQATAVYLESGKMDVDNETVVAGEGTQMEHHWDEAFGYLGVPKDFPINTDGLVFWGHYTNQRNLILEINQKIMNAFLKGRAAISNKDLPTRDAAIAEIRPAWELVCVGTALHYLNAGINNFDDIAIRNHSLSEAIGFIYSLKFNPTKKINPTQIDNLLIDIAGASDFSAMKLYDIEVSKLEQARDGLANYYNLSDQKNAF